MQFKRNDTQHSAVQSLWSKMNPELQIHLNWMIFSFLDEVEVQPTMRGAITREYSTSSHMQNFKDAMKSLLKDS